MFQLVLWRNQFITIPELSILITIPEVERESVKHTYILQLANLHYEKTVSIIMSNSEESLITIVTFTSARISLCQYLVVIVKLPSLLLSLRH